MNVDLREYIKDCAKNIIFVNYGNIGDIVVNLVFLQNFANIYKEKNIFVIASPRNYKLLKYDNNIKKIFLWSENKLVSQDYISEKELSSIDTVFFFRAIGEKKPYRGIYNYLKKNFKDAKFIGFVKDLDEAKGFDYFFCHNNIGSVLQRTKSFLEYCSGKVNLIKPKIFIPEFIQLNFKNKLKELFVEERPIVYVNLTAGNKEKYFDYIKRNIPNRIYFSILNLLRDYKVNVILTGYDISKKMRIKLLEFSNIYRSIKYIENIDIYDLCCLIKQAFLIITPETSVVHIASIFDKPIIAFYSSKKRFKEWPPFSSVFECVFPTITRWMFTINKEKLINVITEKINSWKIINCNI